jgi:hypothetical protein
MAHDASLGSKDHDFGPGISDRAEGHTLGSLEGKSALVYFFYETLV